MVHRGPPDKTAGGDPNFSQSKGHNVPKADSRHDPQHQQSGWYKAAAAAIADMKKVLRKARSIKRNSENLQPHQLGRKKQLTSPSFVSKTKGQIDPVGMMLTPYKAPAAAAAVSTTPNYMIATTSSDARTGRRQQTRQHQVSKGRPLFAAATPTAADKRLSIATPKHLPSNTSPPLPAPPTTSNTPNSFKLTPPKASFDKSLVLAAPLFEDISVSKPTCSSTLKDSGFPNELELHPGGTQLDGTSVYKVCPYQYCSLNGHHHRPPVPIRCFLAAKRRAINGIKLRRLPSPPMRNRVVVSRAASAGVGRERELHISPHSSGLDQGRNDDYFLEIFPFSNQGSDDTTPFDRGQCRPEGGINDDAHNAGNHNNDARSHVAPETDIHLHLLADICGSYTGMNLLDDIIDELSNISISETEVTPRFMDHAECLDQTETTAVAQDKFAASPIKEACQELHLGEFLQQQPVQGQPNFMPSLPVEVDCQQEMPEYAVDDAADQDDPDNSHDIEEEEEEEEDVFNPMGPNLLPVEPDPETTEKLDLTHHSMLDQTDNAQHGDNEATLTYAMVAAEEQHVELPTKHEPIITLATQDHTILETSPTSPNEKPPITTPAPQPLPHMDADSRIRLLISRTAHEEDLDELREFNPREPNFLPLVPQPEPEKVDLRHHMVDDRKNAEEWMIDYALQRAVSNLRPACNKKVALLVEAFETVAPPRYKPPPLRHNHLSFAHTRPMQPCS